MEFRPAMLEAAQQSVILSTFDFNADTAGRELIAALLHTAEWGVKIQIIVDGVSGAFDVTNSGWFQALADHENVELKIYNPLNLFLPRKMMYRMHDKYLIVDESMYLLGGRNSTDLFLGDHSDRKNIDSEAFVRRVAPAQGDSTAQLLDYFDRIWNAKESVDYWAAVFCDFPERSKTSSGRSGGTVMRMRKKKNLVPRMEACAAWLEQNPAALQGHWRECLPGAKEVRLELGCGKGRFTAETAAREPEVLFLAVERVADALVTAMERAKERNLANVRFICGDAAQLTDWFSPCEVNRLYINFCDPWPSKKHAKRRLTSETFLRAYREILAADGQIYFKTDNRPLFDFSLTQFPRAGYTVEAVTNDLHSEEPDTVMTDFEAAFCAEGVKINRCVATLSELPSEPGPEPKLSLLDYWQEGDPIPRGLEKFIREAQAREKTSD